MNQRGFTIVELMVAMLIGLILILAVSKAYLSGLNTQRAQTDVTRLNETARFAFDLLAREARKAGFRNTWQLGSTAGNFCSGNATGSLLAGLNVNSLTQTINPNATDFSGTTFTVANSSDVLRVRYYGDSDGSILDCHGYPVAQAQLVEETLFIAQDPNNNNEPTLYCNTNNPTPAVTNHPGSLPLVAGVESLQLLYGEDTDSDGVVNRYMPWGAVTADNVLSMKASIVVRSPNNIDPIPVPIAKPFNHFSTSSFTYQAATNSDAGALFNVSATDPTIRRIRMMLSSEISFRNFRYCGG